ncbi:MAG TPA: glycosyltransferase [Haliangiales bacterium]|nr:glycosyltransferase [Haliangiales bacterium]
MTESQPIITQARTLLLYAQDSRGLGHINRTLTIARHILAAHPDLVAYVATKSPIASNFTLPERCDYIKLPTRLSASTIQQTAEELESAKQRFRKIRGQILRDAALSLAPDLVLVDHEPLGSAGEFRDGLYALKAQHPGTRFVFGLRDIMDDAAQIRAVWRELGVYEAFENLYDGIAVYGWPKLYDVVEAYAIPPSVEPKLHYCGYIVRDPPVCDAVRLRKQQGLPPSGPLVLATVGSGSDGYPVLNAAMTALHHVKSGFPDLVAVVVTGPFMPPAQQSALQAQATSWCRVLSRADTFQLMAACDAIVSMGGYNSVCEALAVGRPLVIVPRATHKIEQVIRAEMLAERGLARCVHPNALNARSLADALEWALRCDRQAHTRLVRKIIPSFDGAARLTAYLSPWLGGAVKSPGSTVCVSDSNRVPTNGQLCGRS